MAPNSSDDGIYEDSYGTSFLYVYAPGKEFSSASLSDHLFHAPSASRGQGASFQIYNRPLSQEEALIADLPLLVKCQFA